MKTYLDLGLSLLYNSVSLKAASIHNMDSTPYNLGSIKTYSINA